MYRILSQSALPSLTFVITFFLTTSLLRSQNLLKNELVNDSLKTVISSQMVNIPSGDVYLGDARQSEDRQNSINVDSFQLSRFEVTNELFKLFFDSELKNSTFACGFWNSYFGKSPDNYPVRSVTFIEAQRFVKWLSQATGESYRLPTEAEWEFAAKCGQDFRYGTWNGKLNTSLANYNNGKFNTAPVDSFDRNYWELHNLSGNVWEWVDESIEATFSNSASTTKLYMLKGGSYLNQAEDCTSFSRHYLPPNVRAVSCGFRFAKSCK